MPDLYTQASQTDLSEPVNAVRSNRDWLKNIFTQQRGETSDFVSRYSGAIQGQEPLTHISDRIGRELNIPTLRQNANQLNTTLANIPTTYSGATRGFDVNSNQLGRIIGQKSSELAPAVQAANSAYQGAEQIANDRVGYVQQEQEKLLKPYGTEQEFLQERLARETTGYTQSMESELNALIDKVKNGVTLSEGERTRANQLAMLEKQLKNAMDIAKMQDATSRYTIDKNPFGL